MNTIQKRIKEAAEEYANSTTSNLLNVFETTGRFEGFEQGAAFALQNQWISVEEDLPTEKRIIAKISKEFCGKDDCYEILHRIEKEHIDLKHPDGYYDSCGENVPTNAITHWMLIQSLEGGEK